MDRKRVSGGTSVLGWTLPRAGVGTRDRAMFQQRKSSNALAHLVFIITVVSTSTLGWALYDSTQQAHESSSAAQHSHEVLAAVADFEQHLARAEFALRAFVVSGNEAFGLEKDAAVGQARDSVSRLAILTSDNGAQQQRLRTLSAAMHERIALMDRTVAAYSSGGISGAGATARAAQRSSDAVFAAARTLEQSENDLLQARRVREDERHRMAIRLLAAFGVLTLLIVVPGYFIYLSQSRARTQLERRFRNMADGVPGVVFRYRSYPSDKSTYEFLSSGVRDLFGVDKATALEDADVIAALACEEDRNGLSAAIAEAATTLSPMQYDFRVTTPDGAAKWIRSSAAPHKDRADGSVVWNGHWADITRQKRMEQDLQVARVNSDAANMAKSNFLAVMSHEIRTPMNGVLGMLELLSLTKLDRDQRNTVNVVRESGRSLQRIIDDILDFSKIEAGKLEISPEPASVREIVEGARDVYAGNASSKGLLLTCAVDAAIGPAHLVDPLRLRQILNNLVSNAIKFTTTGEIRVSAELVERTSAAEVVRFKVSDGGVGMSEAEQARVFQPFMQSGARTAHRFGGTGLGLSISLRLAEMMGGSIRVESAPGAGTTMIVTLALPISDAAALPATSEAPLDAAGAMPLTPPRAAPSVAEAEKDGTLVLLVDDHSVNRMVLVRQLNAIGYAVETAADGVEALAMWDPNRFGALVTDCNMPEMDGYELTRRIREQERRGGAGRAPIIACTANALRGEAEACIEAGMDDYLPKPVQLAAIQRKLYQWLPIPATQGDAVPPALGIERQREPKPHEPGDVFDPTVLAAISGGIQSIETEILNEFRGACAADVAALRAAAEQRDLDALARVAHRIRGAARTVGLVRLARTSERMETAARARDTDSIEPALDAVQDEYRNATAYLQHRLERAAA